MKYKPHKFFLFPGHDVFFFGHKSIISINFQKVLLLLVGNRIANKFIVTPRTLPVSKSGGESSNYITYPDTCAWLGAFFGLVKLQKRTFT